MAGSVCLIPSNDEFDAIALQIEEVELQIHSSKDKYPENEPPDSQLSLLELHAELTNLVAFYEDERIARSLAKALEDDAELLGQFLAQEQLAETDRALVLRHGNTYEDIGEDYLEAFEAKESDMQQQHGQPPSPGTPSDDGSASGPSSLHSTQQIAALEPLLLVRSTRCLACQEVFQPQELVKCPCDHVFCTGCLASLFKRASTDESLFPPRCCHQSIPRILMEGVLSQEELSDFDSSAVEFTTPNRTYCARPDCGKFIPVLQPTSDLIVCPHCAMLMCSHCKESSHTGDCIEDQSLKVTLQLAQGEGWQRCHGCNAMVELKDGCNHITCKCRAEFCYACGSPWKNCLCEIWEERNLIHQAEQIVERDAIRPLALPERQRQVRRVREELLENHECSHPGRWEKREGYRRKGYKCEMCGARHWKYILACRHCYLVACEECRRHRV